MASFGLFYRHTSLRFLRLSILIKYKKRALPDNKIASKYTHILFPFKSIKELKR